MAVFDVFNPLRDVKLLFTEEQLEHINIFFYERAKALLVINEGEPIDVFDSEKRNYLEIDDLQGIVTNYGEPFSETEVLELIRDANVRGDGIVVYEDFVNSLFNVAPELHEMSVEYLYDDADEDPSLPPLPPEPEPEPEPQPEAPPPPPPTKGKKGRKKK